MGDREGVRKRSGRPWEGRGGKAREIMIHYTHAEAVYLSLEVLDLTFKNKSKCCQSREEGKIGIQARALGNRNQGQCVIVELR